MREVEEGRPTAEDWGSTTRGSRNCRKEIRITVEWQEVRLRYRVGFITARRRAGSASDGTVLAEIAGVSELPDEAPEARNPLSSHFRAS